MKRLTSIFVLLMSFSCLSYDGDVVSACFSGNVSGEGVSDVQRWIDANKASPSVKERMILAACELSLGNGMRSLRYIDSVLDENEECPLALQMKAKALMSQNRISEAEAALRRSIEVNSGDIDDYFLLFEVLEENGRDREMEQVLRKKLEELKEVHFVDKDASSRIFLDEVSIYMMLSEVLYESNRKDEALKILEEGLSRSNASADLFGALIFSLEGLGKKKEVEKARGKYCHKTLLSQTDLCQKQEK